MAMIRPTLNLEMDLDERIYTPELALDIKRSYMHVARAAVFPRPACEGDPQHVLRFNIALRQDYWDANDAEAQSNWQGVMPKWLRNMFYKVSAAMVAYNKVVSERGDERIVFSWLELAFGDNLLLSIHLGSDSSIADCTLDLVESARTLCAQNAFGGSAKAISIPSRQSYALQEDAATVVKVVEPEAIEPSSDVDGEVPVGADEAQPVVVKEIGPFDIDYSVWGVSYSDGGQREFNYQTKEELIR